MTASDTWLSYPDAPRIRTPPPGPRSRALLTDQARLETDAVVYSKYFPVALASAQGSTVEDVDGNRFIDWVAGVSVLNLGHRHPAMAAALAEQAGKIWHALELPTEARIAFLKAFVDALPGGLRGHARVLFTVTGGDAVETAVNLADHAKGRHGTVVFSGAYHGVHGGAANLTSGRRYHRTTSFHGGTMVRVPFPDPYRPVLGSPDDLTNATIRYLEHLANDPHSGVDEMSSVLVEPILGEGGYVVPPDDF
ncbi:MAG TPA: aminotransferase class III-fold pyridoxal phosphate-dependent enzyme, partial [Thermoplasmata archaeon]|nr:aminotransferase class III-fold pyridoxal phosphate-dependent enzyme [Thermoplasmata archaeon]